MEIPFQLNMYTQQWIVEGQHLFATGACCVHQALKQLPSGQALCKWLYSAPSRQEDHPVACLCCKELHEHCGMCLNPWLQEYLLCLRFQTVQCKIRSPWLRTPLYAFTRAPRRTGISGVRYCHLYWCRTIHALPWQQRMSLAPFLLKCVSSKIQTPC